MCMCVFSPMLLLDYLGVRYIYNPAESYNSIVHIFKLFVKGLCNITYFFLYLILKT